jgi:hypothetical protein
MIEKPGPSEWDTSGLGPERTAYLVAARYEDIIATIKAEAQIESVWVEPVWDKRGKEQQICFRLHVSPRTGDQFYNSPDGLRGRYWQSPDHGYVATRQLIDVLGGALSKHVQQTPPNLCKRAVEMDLPWIEVSLSAASAKVSVREIDAERNTLIDLELGPFLNVKRWCQSKPRGLWRWSPLSDSIEVIGALITRDGREYIPEAKRDRSYQIHMGGHT